MLFSFELVYAGVFRIINVPQEISSVDDDRVPAAAVSVRGEIIATSVRNGRLPPLMLEPVDFVGLYRQNMERQAAAQAASGAKPS